MGSRFDFGKSGKSFNKFLKREGLDIDGTRYFRELWDELSDPKSRWSVDGEDLETFIEVVPKDVLKRNFTWDTVQRIVAPVDQPKYEKMLSMKTKAEVRASYIRRIPKTLTVTRSEKGKCTIRGFLGDITDKIGAPRNIASGTLYRDFYDSLEQEIGKKRIHRTIAHVVPEVGFEVTDWPNMSTIDDAQYEIEFFFEPDEVLLQELAKAVATAVSKLF